MRLLQHLLLVVLLVVGTQLVSGQDYQDYQENTPRAAPLRLRPQSNLVEQPQQRVAPVAILKQINKHNEDGSYTYGYEGADGSFKIETKLATGEVKGKYGYVDETGKVRVVEYGANQYGFQPSGEGITVAPPTLVDESAKDEPEYEDEPIKRPQQQQQYRYQQRPQIQHRPSLPPPPPPPQAPPQRPQPQYVQYEEEEEEPEPPRRQYAPQAAPAPPRLQIPGGQRTTEVLYTAVPRPVHPEAEYSQIQSYGDAGSNLRISRPVYAPPPSNPSPSSARAHGFLAPASGRPLLSAFDFGPSSTPRAQQAIPTQQLARYQPQPQTPPQHRYQPQPSIQVQPQYPQPQPQPQAHAQPQPQPQPQPQSQHQSQYQPQSRGGSSLLDQLARDYALPQSNSQPLHDISFGYY